MDRKHLVVALLLAIAAPSHALFDKGNVGIPTGTPGLEIGDPPPPPPPLPPIGIQRFGTSWMEIGVRPPAGRVSRLSKQSPGTSFLAFQDLTAGVDTTIRDESLSPGKAYCYRMDITGGAQPDESHTRCMTTDWRVGFEGVGITRAESAEVLRLFDWADTQRLAEGSEAEPALYYMNLLISNDDVEPAGPLSHSVNPVEGAIAAYRRMGLHVQTTPFFPAELGAWDDGQAVAADCGPSGPVGPVLVGAETIAARRVGVPAVFQPGSSCAPIGRWVFVAVPGRLYNELRAQMLEQQGRGEEAGVRALVFRRIPVPDAIATGVTQFVLNYTYLGQQGFEFNATPRCWSNGDGTSTCEQPLIGWILRKVTHFVVELVDGVIEGVRAAIGRVMRLVKDELQLVLDFRVLNTDPVFGTAEPMRSGWSGEELKLTGVRIEVRQGLGAFFGETDANGRVTLMVAKNSDTKVCIQLENDTAELTEYLIEKTICVADLGKFTAAASRTVDVSHPYVNALVGMTDADRYLTEMAGGFDMPKLSVLVGEQADGLAAAGRSFAPCMGHMPSVIGLGADLLGLLGSLVNPAFLATTTAIEFFYSVDIVLRTEDDDSRGVPVHEYGHAVMCEMLSRQGPDAFQIAWTDIIFATRDQSAGSEASYLNEAWADFIAEQVVGGSNYFAPGGDSVPSLHMNYCEAGESCYDSNFSGSSTFEDQVARVVSTLHDAFDGHAQGAGPNDGSHWTGPATGPLAHVGAADSDRGDEAVALSGARFETLFEHWDDRGTLMREDNFLGGLADLMAAEGVAESDICALFELHDPSRSCPSFVSARTWMGWLGEVGDAGGLATFAAAPAPGSRMGVPMFANGASRPALVSAIASLQPVAAPGSEPEADTCEACSAPVVLEGVQKVAIAGAGKGQRDIAFAFRLGDGAFEAIDPLGQLVAGAWDARDAKGAKARLHADANGMEAIVRLLEQSALELGVDASGLHVVGPAKIELRVAKGGALVGKVTVRFELEVDGRLRRGSYVAKLAGA
jgi:hypothetical protein